MQASPGPLPPMRGDTEHTVSPSHKHAACACGFCPTKPMGVSSDQGYLRLARRPPLSNKHQNPRLPEGRRGFSIDHAVCTNSPGTINYPQQFNAQNSPRAKSEDAGQGPSFQADLSRGSSLRPAMLTLV